MATKDHHPDGATNAELLRQLEAMRSELAELRAGQHELLQAVRDLGRRS